MANCVVEGGKVRSLTQMARLKDESKGDNITTEVLSNETSTYALMGNLFVSEGKPGKVGASSLLLNDPGSLLVVM